MGLNSRIGCALATALTVAGCVTTVDPVVRNAPLKAAFAEPVESLRTRSDNGDRHAQYALSFLMQTGLRGVEKDALGAEALRARAGETRTQAMPIYVPGVNGNPGSTIMTQISSPGVSDAEARRLDACGAMLLLGEPAMGGAICGSPEAYIDLLPAGAAVREEMVRKTLSAGDSVDPATVSDCAATDALWGDAAFRITMGDHAGAAAASDRIIALCGEGRPSWHARVMRAQIHLDAGEPDAAVTVMAPVPRPAPAPIGAFASQVVMAAEAQREDWVGYRRERDALTAASVTALRAEPATRILETFAVSGGSAELFARDGALFPGLEGEMVVLTTLTDERAAPRAIWLTRRDGFVGQEAVWFLDEYRCDGRSTLTHFNARPSTAAVREHVERRMNGTLEPMSSSSQSGLGPASACRWPVQVAPGLGDDPVVLAREADQAAAESASSTPLP
ncbi:MULTISPECIES: hypothetical protein [unclassified Brevundimonas]|uniref:hypothetical protein n=1 Tax=unclassified Brevundimonas TaxID=2622653 RepID=UPI0025C370A8|nr:MULTISPECIES: hypothetical protein [unclassified Brevundimonas]